jgi:ubiquinone/menaquinone biosynthesis C-methylase UbiE
VKPSSPSDPVRRTYDRLASEYDVRWRRYTKATVDAALRHVTFTGHEHVLDIGCGTGAMTTRLLERWPGVSVTGVDISLLMLAQARAKARSHWVQANAGRLPFRAGSFDAVTCANSFHFFHSPRATLAEIHRVLRPTGQLVLVDWCDDYLTCKLCGLWLRWTDRAFHRAYTAHSCRKLLDESGFVVLNQARFRVDWLWGLMQFVCRT